MKTRVNDEKINEAKKIVNIITTTVGFLCHLGMARLDIVFDIN